MTVTNSTANRRASSSTEVVSDARGENVRALAKLWAEAGLDYAITVSFSEETYGSLGLKNPERMMLFAKDCLERAGYYGPSVIVVHDKSGGSYWHPHILVKDAARGREVEREFFRYGDLGSGVNGPIDGFGCFIYHANRAAECWPASEHWDFNPRERRRPRPRGRGRAASRHRASTA